MPDNKRIVLNKLHEENPFFVETLTNKYNGQRQVQVNDTYDRDGTPQYARRGVNINVEDVPTVIRAMAELYEAETGKPVEGLQLTG